MAQSLLELQDYLAQHLRSQLLSSKVAYDELTLEINASNVQSVARFLRNDDVAACEILIDLCGIDYLSFGQDEWSTTNSGFSRGVDPSSTGRFSFEQEAEQSVEFDGHRFAVVYHLLSVTSNHRIRLKALCEDNEMPIIDTVVCIWNSANWFEREAFDLFGIIFKGHPDLRRILTDYGFIGHPFRKDFPLVGTVEMRYDEETRRVVYEPVSIEPRVLVPRVIRDDMPNPVEINE